MPAADDDHLLTGGDDRTTPADGGDRHSTDMIARELREMARRAARRGEPLPSEPTLVATFGISRPALREILARLESEGLIRRRQGAMTIVNPCLDEIVARFDHRLDPAERVRRAGFEPTLDVLECGPVALGGADAAALLAADGAPALRTVKRWSADGVPALVTVDVIPLLEHAQPIDLATVDPQASLVELVTLLRGDTVEWELAWPSALIATARLRAWFRSPRRSALLTLDLVGVGRRGQRCYRTCEYHVPGVVRSGFIRIVRD